MDNRLNLYGFGVRGVLNKAAEGAGRTPAGSNIAPIARMGRPVRSWASRASEMLPDPNAEWGILGTKGNIAAGLAAGLKSGLGFYGAMKDAKAEQAYNDALAAQGEQERQDKLAQQEAEMDYKNRALAQQAELAQNQLNAQAALEAAKFGNQQTLQNNQFAQQKAMEELKNNYATDLLNAQTKAAQDAAALKREQEQEDMLLKQLDPARQQQFIEMKKQGQNPVIIDNKVGTIGKFLGNPKYTINEKDAEPKTLQVPEFNLPLGFGNFFSMGRKIGALKQAQPQAQQATDVQSNRAAMDAAWGK